MYSQNLTFFFFSFAIPKEGILSLFNIKNHNPTNIIYCVCIGLLIDEQSSTDLMLIKSSREVFALWHLQLHNASCSTLHTADTRLLPVTHGISIQSIVNWITACIFFFKFLQIRAGFEQGTLA